MTEFKTDANREQIFVRLVLFKIERDIADLIEEGCDEVDNVRNDPDKLGLNVLKQMERKIIPGGSHALPVRLRVGSDYDVDAAIERWRQLAELLRSGAPWELAPQ